MGCHLKKQGMWVIIQAYFCFWQMSWNGARWFCVRGSGVGTLVVGCVALFEWRARTLGLQYFLTPDEFWVIWWKWWSCNERWSWNDWICVHLWCWICVWYWKGWIYMCIDWVDVLPVVPVPVTLGFYVVWPWHLSLTYHSTF